MVARSTTGKGLSNAEFWGADYLLCIYSTKSTTNAFLRIQGSETFNDINKILWSITQAH